MTTLEQQHLWEVFNHFIKSRERVYRPQINKVLQNQIKDFIEAKKNGLSDTDALNSINSLSLYDVLKPLYLDAGIVYGAKVIAYLPKQKARMPIGFNAMMIDLLNNYFSIDLLNVVENITDFTKEKIRDVLIAAYSLGNSFTEIANELSAIGFTQQRARLIARTETVTAANTGGHLAAKTTGLQLQKVWVSAHDNRTRRIPRDRYDHLTMDTIAVGRDELFTVSGEKMLYPGDRKNGASAGNICNCRCTHGYKAIRDNTGRLMTV